MDWVGCHAAESAGDEEGRVKALGLGAEPVTKFRMKGTSQPQSGGCSPDLPTGKNPACARWKIRAESLVCSAKESVFMDITNVANLADPEAATLETKNIAIDGMTREEWVRTIEKSLRGKPGIRE